MYEYAKNNGLGNGFNKTYGIRHFKVLEDNLLEDEEPVMTFIGLHNYKSPTKHDNNYAFALTNKRIIMGQWKMIGQEFQSIELSGINDVTFSSGLFMGILTIDFIREKFNVGLDKQSANNISRTFMSEFSKLKKLSKNSEIKDREDSISSVEKVREFKSLLDDGIISQDEFEKRKKNY